jgi:hypothetical protein
MPKKILDEAYSIIPTEIGVVEYSEQVIKSGKSAYLEIKVKIPRKMYRSINALAGYYNISVIELCKILSKHKDIKIPEIDFPDLDKLFEDKKTSPDPTHYC